MSSFLFICFTQLDDQYNCLQGIKNFAKFGLGLEIARNLIYNYKILLDNPAKGLSVLFQRLNWSLVGFLAAYKGIYLVNTSNMPSHCLHFKFVFLIFSI